MTERPKVINHQDSGVIKRRYFCCFSEHFETVAPIAKLYNRNKSTVFLLCFESSKVLILFLIAVENVELGWRSYFALAPPYVFCDNHNYYYCYEENRSNDAMPS